MFRLDLHVSQINAHADVSFLFSCWVFSTRGRLDSNSVLLLCVVGIKNIITSLLPSSLWDLCESVCWEEGTEVKVQLKLNCFSLCRSHSTAALIPSSQ